MGLARLEPSVRVGDQVYEAIHDAIMSGDLRAGQRLRIRQLADRLGTSVMPVREALARLEEVGLVITAPYRGAVVKEFTSVELRHSYEVRRLLEVEAARLGAPAMTTTDMAGLRGQLTLMAASVAEERVTDYLDQDEAFLACLYAGADNPVLSETITVLWRRCRSYKIFGVRRELAAGRGDALLTFQDRLMEAAAARDGESAARITAESLDAAISRIDDALTLGPASA